MAHRWNATRSRWQPARPYECVDHLDATQPQRSARQWTCGRFFDNVFIERLWRSLMYEEVYLKSHADGREARAGIASWISFLQRQTPSPGAWRPNADGRLARRNDRRTRWPRCGHGGQRRRAAHMPAAATATATLRYGRMTQKDGAAQKSINNPAPVVLRRGASSTLSESL